MRRLALFVAFAAAAAAAWAWWPGSAGAGGSFDVDAMLAGLQEGVAAPWQFAWIVLGTFALEDPTTVATGLLVAEGHVSAAVGVSALFTGIFLGDLGLYLIGRLLGARLVNWGWLGAHGSAPRRARLRAWIERRGWVAIVASRFVPGTRVPLYIGAGAVGAPGWRFALWTCGAVMIWAPVMTAFVVLLTRAPGSPVARLLSVGPLGLLGAAVGAFVSLRVLTLLLTRVGRCKLAAAVARLWRWEFWPTWVIYLPLVPGWLRLAWRYRSWTVWTLANPGIPLGGLVGESKADILRRLGGGSRDEVSEFERIEPGPDARERLEQLRAAAASRGWSYPIVLKPDAGQRGSGVRKIANDAAAAAYFDETPGPVLAQPLCPYGEEAGVFYARVPGDREGRIFSITAKRFPVVVGDGRSTLAELIWTHPRYRMQAGMFLRRHPDAGWTQPAAGERVALAFAGNHSQGVEFRDGAHLNTPELAATIDAVARRFEGFCFGRFDLRYRDDEALKAGRQLTILELNGVTSESTDVYDPSNTLLRAWRKLLEQWRLAFEIGAAHRARGATPPTVRALLTTIVTYYRTRQVPDLSD